MTPVELLAIVIVLGVLRLVLTLRRPGAPAAAEARAAGPAAKSSGTTVIEEYLDAFITAGLVALLVITFLARTFYIPSGSMEPTLQIHDVLLVGEFEYRFSPPHDGDIVVFPPPIPTSDDFIKRLVAGPGEKLRIHGGVVYRNGRALAEPYEAQRPGYELEIRDYGVYVDGLAIDPSQGNIPPRSAWTAPDTIPPNCYFMMGDNRNMSEDSHIWGFAQRDGTFATGPEAGKRAGFTGHALFLLWPFNRIRGSF